MENVTDSKTQDKETPSTINENKVEESEQKKQTANQQMSGLDSDDDERPTGDGTHHLDPKEVPHEDALNSEIAHSSDSNQVICPCYTFKQDADTVIFVIQEPSIDAKSVKKDIHVNDNCEVKVQFRTKSADESEDTINQYFLHVQFDQGCVIGEVMVELTTEGAVVIMVKESSCRGEWSGFKAGSSGEKLQVISCYLVNSKCKYFEM